MARLSLIFLLGASVGCFSCTPKSSQVEPTVAPEVAPTVLAPPGKAEVAPKLVVLIVVDQLASWVLDLYLPILPKSSLLRRAVDNGVHHRAAFPYASTQTAPGHASLTTGVPPAIHGIVANAIFDPAHGPRKTVDDREHTVLGNPERFVSPFMLQAPTVADALYQKSGGKARVVGISMKARSAALPVGMHPSAVVFFDANARALTTSTFYAPSKRLPEWLRDFVTANPVEPLMQVWEPERPDWLRANFGADDQPGEMYPTFPHDPRDAPNPYQAFSSLPDSTEYLIAAAFAAVKAEGMGMDDVPDFLMLGISGTDIIGHIWGPHSWEYADNLLRTDRALGRFVAILEARGPVAFLLTADHGVAPLPENTRKEGKSGGRIRHAEVIAAAKHAADQGLGQGDWIAAYVPPFITYTESGRTRRKELDKILIKHMPAVEGVRAVYAAHRGAELRASNRDVERLVGANLPTDPPGDLYLVTDEGWFDALAQQGGTNHGTPWAYDRQVPVIMWGAGIESRPSTKIHSVLQVATSLAALLDVPAPVGAPQSPLPGVMRLHD